MARKPKTIDLPVRTELFSRNNRRKLNTVGAIASEQGKIYRAAASGTLETGEAMRLSLLLRELRASMEAAKEAATFDMPAGGFTTEFNVYAIPRGVQFSSDGQTLVWPSTGAPADPLPFTPFEATPDWTRQALTDQTASPEPSPVREVVDDSKVTVLRPWRDRDDPVGVA